MRARATGGIITLQVVQIYLAQARADKDAAHWMASPVENWKW